MVRHEQARQLQAPSLSAPDHRPCGLVVLPFPLSLRLVEEMLLERGSVVSYETVRRWALKFGPAYTRGTVNLALSRRSWRRHSPQARPNQPTRTAPVASRQVAKA
jgi:hypothetical protein